MTDKSYIDIRNLFSVNPSASFDENTKITTLTPDKFSMSGAIAGTTAINLKHDFTFVADVFLGQNSRGADGIAIAFHQGAIGFVGSNGGGLGILGAPQGVGFELDTYWSAPSDEKGDSFGHGTVNAAHAGFVSTDKNSNYLTEIARIQKMDAPDGTWRTLTIKWASRDKKLTASLQKGSQIQNWELPNPPFDLNKKYTFVIGAATGAVRNLHQIGITEFKASFSKPRIQAKDVTVKQGTSFDPLHYAPIELKAVDEVDGDITKNIQVLENTVNTAKPGDYKVTYTVKNSYGESDQKTIKVTVPIIDDYWENGDAKGWKFFSGEELTLSKDKDKALVGEWVFFADKHVAIYKEIQLQKGEKYKVTVCIKPKDESTVATHFVKVSLKANHSSPDSRSIINTTLNRGEIIQKGYRKLSAEFTANDNETDPLFIIENYNAGWIGSIKVSVE
jgi:hypothetical protein